MLDDPTAFDIGPWTPGQWAEEAKFEKQIWVSKTHPPSEESNDGLTLSEHST